MTPISQAVSASITPAESKPAKVEDAARQFESLLIHQMMRSAWESSSGGLGDDGLGDDSGDSEGSVMRDLACQQFAQLLARHGGIGMTRLIVQGLGASGSAAK
jgi:Rod binding domain-containing protein